MPQEELDGREVDFVDIAADSLAEKHYKESEVIYFVISNFLLLSKLKTSKILEMEKWLHRLYEKKKLSYFIHMDVC